VPITPKVSVSGGSWVGEDEGGLEVGLLVGALGLEEADESEDESQAARTAEPRRAAAARRVVAPRVRLALARTAKTLVAGRKPGAPDRERLTARGRS
jgi:hypothetical protein